jgi:hypothetical protein
MAIHQKKKVLYLINQDKNKQVIGTIKIEFPHEEKQETIDKVKNFYIEEGLIQVSRRQFYRAKFKYSLSILDGSIEKEESRGNIKIEKNHG